jgi:hypothetical protein
MARHPRISEELIIISIQQLFRDTITLCPVYVHDGAMLKYCSSGNIGIIGSAARHNTDGLLLSTRGIDMQDKTLARIMCLAVYIRTVYRQAELIFSHSSLFERLYRLVRVRAIPENAHNMRITSSIHI